MLLFGSLHRLLSGFVLSSNTVLTPGERGGDGGLKISEGVPPHTPSPPKIYTEKNQKLAVSPPEHPPPTTKHAPPSKYHELGVA
jgi:hypothetical protein